MGPGRSMLSAVLFVSIVHSSSSPLLPAVLGFIVVLSARRAIVQVRGPGIHGCIAQRTAGRSHLYQLGHSTNTSRCEGPVRSQNAECIRHQYDDPDLIQNTVSDALPPQATINEIDASRQSLAPLLPTLHRGTSDVKQPISFTIVCRQRRGYLMVVVCPILVDPTEIEYVRRTAAALRRIYV